MLLYPFLGIAAGICFAVQGPTNAALGSRTDRYRASMVSFGGGVLLLAVLVAFFGSGDLRLISQARAWQLLGGIYGVFGVVVSVAAIPVLGAALMLTVNMLGQLVMGTIIDAFGMFQTTAVPIAGLRLCGIAVTALGILLIYVGRDSRKNPETMHTPGMIALSFISGVAGAVQSPTNAALAKIVGSLEGTLVSFCVGFLLITVLTLIADHGRLQSIVKSGAKPWMVIGGLYGVTALFINVIVTPILGVALLVACSTLGQLLGSMAVDSFGWLGVRKLPVNARRVTGIVTIAIGVCLVTAAKMIS